MEQKEQNEICMILEKCRLCRGMSHEEIQKNLLAESRVRTFSKGSLIFGQGEKPENMYVLLSGKISIAKTTSFGRRIMMSVIESPGDLFGEIYLFLEKQEYEVEAEASADAVVLEISDSVFKEQSGLTANLLTIFAGKAYQLNKKVRLLGSGTLREKIALFLIEQEEESGIVKLPFNREEMADYMGVARPSLSRELGAMTAEGIIGISGRKIKILDQEKLEGFL